MKKILAVCFFALFTITANSQQLNIKQHPLDPDYFSKGNSNQTLGWILAGGGAALVIAGVVVHGSNQSYAPTETIGTVLMVGGGAALVTGAIILISSGNKKNDAEQISINLKMEHAVSMNLTGMKTNYYPAASFKIGLFK